MTNSEKLLDDKALDILWRDARTHSHWQDKDVPDELLKKLYDLVKYGPTSANCCPARILFIRSPEAKERLRPYLDEGNVGKTMKAPVTAIIGYDRKFHDHLSKLFPHADARSWFVGDEKKIEETAFRNGTLQGGYFILAARAVGLDCGPMSGFDIEGVRKAFFSGTEIQPNFLCNLGYGVPEKLYPRLPRFEFDEICSVL